MKRDLIVVGGQYMVALKPKHILIPGTDVTYVERLKMFDSLDLSTLPKAALQEKERLERVLFLKGLDSRIGRCEGVYGPSLDGEFKVSTDKPLLLLRRVATIAIVTATSARAVYLEADFHKQGGGFGERLVGDVFDPSIPASEEPPEGATDEEFDAWIAEDEERRRDPAGTLTAVVHPQAIKRVVDEGLLDRLAVEYQEASRRAEAESDRRWRMMKAEKDRRWRARAEQEAAKLMEHAADSILREANRPDDDEWQPLA